MKFFIFTLFITIVGVSCKETDNSSIDIGSGNTYPTLIRIGLFSGLNGVTTTGQIEIYRNESTLQETFETLNDFHTSGITGSIQFWLTDNTGSTNLSSSTKKLLLGTLESGYDGIHSFSLQLGEKSFDYTHAVVFGVNGNKNIGKALLVLPLPPG